MSVINQVLLDLEKRRASSAERGLIHSHVRAMPQAGNQPNARRYTILGAALLISIATWAAVNAFEWKLPGADQREATGPQRVDFGANPISVEDGSISNLAESAMDAVHTPETRLAARMSFELSRLPEPLVEPDAQPATAAAIASARVLGKGLVEAPVTPARTAAVETRNGGARRSEERAALSVPSRATGAAESATPVVDPGAIDKRVRQPTVQQLAEAEFRKATALLHQGRSEEARTGFEAALNVYPGHHRARQALLGVLVEAKRNADAERVMQEGLQLAPHQIGFAIALARLQVDRGDSAAAITTLQRSASYARESGDYHAFLGGLLQRELHHADAIEQFAAALRVKPDHGIWLLGLGISLHAVGRGAEAREVFHRAKASATLTADLRALAEQRLESLR